MKFLTRLRAAWDSLWVEPTLAPAPIPTTDKDEVRWNQVLSLLSTKDEPPRRNYALPEVLPGVRPVAPPKGEKLKLAMDGAGYQERMAQDDAIAPAAWGFSGAGQLGPGLAFLGFPYLAELNQITEYRTPAEVLSTEMTRRWGKLTNKGDDDLDEQLAELTEDIEVFKLRDHFRKCALFTEEFGRSHLGINIKDQDDDITRQLPLTEIKKDTLLGFQPIEPYWMTPYSWNATHPRRPDFYKPQSWYELGKKTHFTRYCTFIFREVPDLLKPAYDFSGISMTQLMMPYVTRWLRSAKNINDLINIFSIVTLATDLQALLKDPAKFVARLQAFTQGRDNRGVMAINKDTEELAINDASLASLDKLQAQSQEHMATPGRLPLIKFFGITPTGLSTTSEGEFQNFYDYVHAMQELGYSPHMETCLKLLQLNRYGKVNPNIGWEWLPLYEPTGKELAEIRKSDADRDHVYVTDNVVSPDEVRDKLKKDPESGYNGLVGDAPEPQEWGEVDEDGNPVAAPPGAEPSSKPPKKEEE